MISWCQDHFSWAPKLSLLSDTGCLWSQIHIELNPNLGDDDDNDDDDDDDYDDHNDDNDDDVSLVC